MDHMEAYLSNVTNRSIDPNFHYDKAENEAIQNQSHDNIPSQIRKQSQSQIQPQEQGQGQGHISVQIQSHSSDYHSHSDSLESLDFSDDDDLDQTIEGKTTTAMIPSSDDGFLPWNADTRKISTSDNNNNNNNNHNPNTNTSTSTDLNDNYQKNPMHVINIHIPPPAHRKDGGIKTSTSTLSMSPPVSPMYIPVYSSSPVSSSLYINNYNYNQVQKKKESTKDSRNSSMIQKHPIVTSTFPVMDKDTVHLKNNIYEEKREEDEGKGNEGNNNMRDERSERKNHLQEVQQYLQSDHKSLEPQEQLEEEDEQEEKSNAMYMLSEVSLKSGKRDSPYNFERRSSRNDLNSTRYDIDFQESSMASQNIELSSRQQHPQQQQQQQSQQQQELSQQQHQLSQQQQQQEFSQQRQQNQQHTRHSSHHSIASTATLSSHDSGSQSFSTALPSNASSPRSLSSDLNLETTAGYNYQFHSRAGNMYQRLDIRSVSFGRSRFSFSVSEWRRQCLLRWRRISRHPAFRLTFAITFFLVLYYQFLWSIARISGVYDQKASEIFAVALYSIIG